MTDGSGDDAGEGMPLSLEISRAFASGDLDLSLRKGAPPVGWDSMPECSAARRIRGHGATDAAVRIFVTLVSALDRARDADRLWQSAAEAYVDAPWAFEPAAVAEHSLLELQDLLRRYGVSQRHTVDSAVWRTIAEALLRAEAVPAIHEAIHRGIGQVSVLRREVEAATPEGSPLFPMLRGPKVARMWIRMLAVPGNAVISGFGELEMAVDVQVQKVTAYLGLRDVHGQDVEKVRDSVQAAWAEQIARFGAAGPDALRGTAAALDPAVWFFGKWGCTFCERAGKRLPIHAVCRGCRFKGSSSA
jgi:hypothetical protein